MAASHEPNPLRPYYIPPSVGSPLPPGSLATSSTANANANPTRLNTSFQASPRDYLPDLDIDLKSTTSEAWQHTRSLFDTLAWRYASVVLAQPFDVAKTILQVSLPPSAGATAPPRTGHTSGSTRGRRAHNEYIISDNGNDSDGSDGIPDYFSATAPRSRSPRKRRKATPNEDASQSPTPRPRDRREHVDGDIKLRLKKPDSVMGAISALYTSSGAVGLWRASNTTFLYSILLRTTDSFIRSLLLAVLGLPEIPGPDQGGLAPGLSISGGVGFSGIDLSDSPNALASLLVTGIASCLTGLLLAPLDLVRTRFIVTPISGSKRGLLSNLKRLPSLVAPHSLWLPTALYHSIPNIFSAATPLFLRRQLRITPELTPSLWSLASFAATLAELFVRLPLETINRRAQIASLRSAEPEIPLIVDPAPYSGLWGTIRGIVYAEGEKTTKASNGMLRTRRGQGTAGLVRGWRVGFWGLVGVWGAGALGSGDGKNREF